jgi:hypothetical protein
VGSTPRTPSLPSSYSELTLEEHSIYQCLPHSLVFECRCKCNGSLLFAFVRLPYPRTSQPHRELTNLQLPGNPAYLSPWSFPSHPPFSLGRVPHSTHNRLAHPSHKSLSPRPSRSSPQRWRSTPHGHHLFSLAVLVCRLPRTASLTPVMRHSLHNWFVGCIGGVSSSHASTGRCCLQYRCTVRD